MTGMNCGGARFRRTVSTTLPERRYWSAALRSMPSDSLARVAVQDNGIGAEYPDRIFEMFGRLHTHDEYEGTGMDLAVVKRIVERPMDVSG